MGSLASRNVVRVLKMCVWLPQEATLCKEPTPGGKQGPGCLLGQPLSHRSLATLSYNTRTHTE